MIEKYAEILAVGGKSNSLGRTDDVIHLVLSDKNKLKELYSCVFNEDAWIRMRAIDAIEKIGRQHPEWLSPYIDKFQTDLNSSKQPSILWHLAQMYGQLNLTDAQRHKVIEWLDKQLSTIEIDWIVAVNSMKTLIQFTKEGFIDKNQAISLIKIQQKHKSKTVVKKANEMLSELNA